jgi:UDP-3-O-[3-hydroxymyristoyl] glucosamine N-acyltransferase
LSTAPASNIGEERSVKESETEYTLGELASILGARLEGDPLVVVSSLGAIDKAQSHQVTHLSSPAYRQHLATTRSGAVLLREADANACPTNALIVVDPYLAFAKCSQLFCRPDDLPVGLHSTAIIDPSARIAADACIGPQVVIGAGSQVASGVRLHAGVHVGERCVIGADTELRSRVVLYSDVHVGERCKVHAGAVIGGDGFGFAPDARGHLHAIAQLGGVRIGHDVSIGCNTTIDRGAIEDTVIEDGVKIDNLVQIGHNCRIGAHSVLCGMVGLAGSTVIGKHCVLAGGSGCGGDKPVVLCDQVTLTAATIVTSSIDKAGVYSGSILHNTHTRWKRTALLFSRLDELVSRVRALEKSVRSDTGKRAGNDL